MQPNDLDIVQASLVRTEKSLILYLPKKSNIVINYNSDRDAPRSTIVQFSLSIYAFFIGLFPWDYCLNSNNWLDFYYYPFFH